MAIAINKRTGKTVSVPDHYIGHPTLGIDLVAEGTEVQAAPKKETKKVDFKADAVDADGDGVIQEGTKWQRPLGSVKIQEQPAPEINTKENEE